jgi:hypothetical protein
LQKPNSFYVAGSHKHTHHNSINTFSIVKLQEPLKNIFIQVVELLAAEGLLNIKELYTDGTKTEANANRYSFVWGNAIKTNKEKMARQLKTMYQYAQSIADKELKESTATGFKTIDAQKVKVPGKQKRLLLSALH